jgi:hypothetical protein
MNRRHALLLCFALACAAQWLAPLWQVWRYENILRHGQVLKLACHAPDPYDPLRGRYLWVAIQPDEFPLKGNKLERSTQVCLRFKPGKDGLHEFDASVPGPANGELSLWLTVNYHWNDKLRVLWPQDRYYLNEDLAPKADAWLRQSFGGKDRKVIAQLRVLNGQAVLEDLICDGRSVAELVRRRGEP